MNKLSLFDQNFKQKLYEQIQKIEEVSAVELVIIVRAKSNNYTQVSLWTAFVIQLIITAYLLFTPKEFDPYFISFATIISFPLAYSLIELIKPLKFLLTPKKLMNKAVEIYARALFQKGNLHLTRDHTGMLIFISLFEKQVFIVADQTIIAKIPPNTFNQISQKLNQIFYDDNLITASLIQKLSEIRPILAEYIPVREDDINEIPDNLQIDL